MMSDDPTYAKLRNEVLGRASAADGVRRGYRPRAARVIAYVCLDLEIQYWHDCPPGEPAVEAILTGFGEDGARDRNHGVRSSATTGVCRGAGSVSKTCHPASSKISGE